MGKVGFDILKDVKNVPESIAKDYKSFEDGVDVIATTIGSVLSCNIVTPLLETDLLLIDKKWYCQNE